MAVGENHRVKARLKHQLERVHASDHGRPADRGGSDGRAPPTRRRESAEEVAAMDRYANARQGWERYQFDNGKPLEEEDPLGACHAAAQPTDRMPHAMRLVRVRVRVNPDSRLPRRWLPSGLRPYKRRTSDGEEQRVVPSELM
jgi:hypothetical protein